MIRARYHDDEVWLVDVNMNGRCVVARGEKWNPNAKRWVGDLKLLIVSLDDIRLPRSTIPLMEGAGPDATKTPSTK
jgi:hypothetical protein